MILNYRSYTNKLKPNIVILHGLFGSLQNWHSISTQLSKDFHVICVDCRNHGESFHSKSMTYDDMANDVATLMEHLSIEKTFLIGHSMGGKIALRFSQLFPQKVIKQLIVDIAPKPYPAHHQSIIDTLLQIKPAHYQSRNDVSIALKDSIPNEMLRGFLLKNLIRNEHQLKWRISVQDISNNYLHIMDWPFSDLISTETLFLRGSQSNYINESETSIQKICTNAKIKSINASHWIHAEKPSEFISITITIFSH